MDIATIEIGDTLHSWDDDTHALWSGRVVAVRRERYSAVLRRPDGEGIDRYEKELFPTYADAKAGLLEHARTMLGIHRLLVAKHEKTIGRLEGPDPAAVDYGTVTRSVLGYDPDGTVAGLHPQRGPKVGGVVMPRDEDTDDLNRDEGDPVATTGEILAALDFGRTAEQHLTGGLV